MNDNQSNNLSALLTGLIIGAAAVYLFNTENGRKLKDELLEDGQKLLERIGKDLDVARNKIEDIQSHANLKVLKKEVVEEKVAEMEAKVEDAAENYVETLVEVPEHIAAVQKKGRKFFFKRGAAQHHIAES